MKDASQLLSDNLAPMLDGIIQYGEHRQKEAEKASDEARQERLITEGRQYQRGVTADDRAYQVQSENRQRANKFVDEAQQRRIDATRKISQAFPGEDVSTLTDAQLDGRALQADRQLTRDNVMEQDETKIRAEARQMGMPNFATSDTPAIREWVVNKRLEEASTGAQKTNDAAEVYQTNRLGTPDGQNAVNTYNQLAARKGELLHNFVALSLQSQSSANPELVKRSGSRAVQLIQQNPTLYAKLGSPEMKKYTLDRIAAGSHDIGVTDKAAMAEIAQAVMQASDDVAKQMLAEDKGASLYARSDVYERKAAMDSSMHEIDSAMARLSEAYPALKKIPSIDVNAFTLPPLGNAPGTDGAGVVGGVGGMGNLPDPKKAAESAAAALAAKQSNTGVDPNGRRVEGLFPWLLHSSAAALPTVPLRTEGYSDIGSGLKSIGNIPSRLFGGTLYNEPDNAPGYLGLYSGGVKLAASPFQALGRTQNMLDDRFRSIDGASDPLLKQTPDIDPSLYLQYLKSQQLKFNPDNFSGKY